MPLERWEGQPGVILRHDIDLDLAPAERMAELEGELGVRATFFVMAGAESYNPSSRRNRARLKAIVEAGGEIGLHFDPSLYGDADHDFLGGAARGEARLLEDIIGRAVNSISLHNPSVTGRFPLFAGWRNAYDPAIFAPDRYLSDSRMMFQADPQTFLMDATARTYQLLLHPLHYSEDGRDYPAPMIDCVCRLAQALNEDYGVNARFRKAVGDDFMTQVAQGAGAWAEKRKTS